MQQTDIDPPPDLASEHRRRRILFRATHRGTYENDILIGGYVRARIAAFTDADLDAIQAIYAHHVHHSVASFEETPPDITELRARRAAVLRDGLPYLVAECDGRVAGVR